jgi:hypothetical protein
VTPKQNEPTDLVVDALEYATVITPNEPWVRKAITLAKLQSLAVAMLRNPGTEDDRETLLKLIEESKNKFIDEKCRTASPPSASARGWQESVLPELIEAAKAHVCDLDSMDVCRHCETISFVELNPYQVWVPVKERLPESNRVLLLYESHCCEVDAGYFTGTSWRWDDNSVAEDVTHWMPLPEPPK